MRARASFTMMLGENTGVEGPEQVRPRRVDGGVGYVGFNFLHEIVQVDIRRYLVLLHLAAACFDLAAVLLAIGLQQTGKCIQFQGCGLYTGEIHGGQRGVPEGPVLFFVGSHYLGAELCRFHPRIPGQGRKEPGVFPPVAGFELFGAHRLDGILMHLIVHFHHAHQARVESQQIEMHIGGVGDFGQGPVELHQGNIVTAVIVIADRPRRQLPFAVVVGTQTGAVVPEHQGVPLSRIVFHSPGGKLNQDVGIAHVHFTQVLNLLRIDDVGIVIAGHVVPLGALPIAVTGIVF